MKINSPTATPKPVPSPRAPGVPWQNPAAAAALSSSAEILKGVEDGVVRNYADADGARGYAADLKATNEILATASEVLLADNYTENDQFVPLVNRAGTGVGIAESKLNSKDLTSTWPFERDDVLSAVRQARVLSMHIARQLGGE
jgi:hypothetical protein